MENEKNNNENKQINQPEGKDKNADAGRKTTAAVLAVVLIAGLLTGGGVYKIDPCSKPLKTLRDMLNAQVGRISSGEFTPKGFMNSKEDDIRISQSQLG